MKLVCSDKAVSEVLGTMIILAITIIGISMITLVGVPYIFKIQDMANVRNVEQTFTIIDSQASKAFFGDNPIQIIDMNLNAGTLEVQMNGSGKESYMVINRTNISDTIYLPMGKLKYHLDERIVAYEGGGIWSKYPSGGSVMLSPPEFHYDGRTLTLPIIFMEGNASIGGKGIASISFTKKAMTQVYPNTSTGLSRVNPLDFETSGKVFVNITSEYYDAWADYARTMSYAKVDEDPSNKMAIIELTVVPNTLGGYTELTNPINLRGLPTDDDTPLENLTFKIEDDNFNSFNWQMKATSGTKTFIIEIKKGTDIGIGYQDTGPGYSLPAEAWTRNNAFTPVDDFVSVNFLDKNINLTYVTNEIVGTATGQCTKKIQNSDENTTGFSWGPPSFTAGTTNKSLYDITQHYIWLLANSSVDPSLVGCSPANKHGPGDDSTMIINYNATGAITFLHVTNNTVSVSIK